MKSQRISILVLFLGCWLATFPLVAQTGEPMHRCATDERDSIRYARFPELRKFRLLSEELLQKYIREDRASLRQTADEEIIRIPVVVHVVHNQSSGVIGGIDNPNITDEQIKTQIQVLTEDYRRKEGTNGFNSNPVGADARIEFYLAEFDEDGRPTTGITRNYYPAKDSFDPRFDDDELAGINHWPSDQYLNIWVCRMKGTILGVAQFPSLNGVNGLDNSQADDTNTDGVFIDFKVFGRSTGAITSSMYNLGRTTTHEVGHWLGLIHPWGFYENNCGTDYCDDTPPTDKPYAPKTAVCQDVFSTCGGTLERVMIENYMDYSPDRCMNVFTADQLARMRAVLALSPRRVKLVENSKKGRLEPSDKLNIVIYPNPVSDGEVKADIRFSDFKNITVTIYDSRGLSVSTISYRDTWSRRIKMDVAKLPRGVYILEVQTDNEVASQRFVVW